jgi:hypothetical protein
LPNDKRPSLSHNEEDLIKLERKILEIKIKQMGGKQRTICKTTSPIEKVNVKKYTIIYHTTTKKQESQCFLKKLKSTNFAVIPTKEITLG